MTWGDITIPALGAGGLLAVILIALFRAIVRGDLVPKSTVDARIADLVKGLADQKAAYEGRLADQKANFEGRLIDKDSIIATLRATTEQQADQLDEVLVPLAETVERVLTALPGGRS